ncbi:MAG: hypothetical protein QXI60_08390 [Thermofilaceae archaeon]
MIDTPILLSAILFFILGLAVGLIVRRIAETIILIAILMILISTMGLVSAPPPDFVREFFPWLIEVGKILPYASIAFIIGLIIGFMKK